MSVGTYQESILNSCEWGDVLEARVILEKHFPTCELVVWNLEQGFPVSIGGGGSGVAQWVGHLVHTGSHFDPLYFSQDTEALLPAEHSSAIKLWPKDEHEAGGIHDKFRAYVEEELMPEYAKWMKCDDCGAVMRSNAAAAQHMKDTEHDFFSECGPPPKEKE